MRVSYNRCITLKFYLLILMSTETSHTPPAISYAFAKRTMDLLLGIPLLCISAPIFVIAALLIRLESKGNPFFIQTRIGLHGKPFKMIKLRGMFIDARERFPEMYEYSDKKNLDFHFHLAHDPRVTKVGSFTRRSSIDELPNFINVVLGNMSLVGPRPEIPEVMLCMETTHKNMFQSNQVSPVRRSALGETRSPKAKRLTWILVTSALVRLL